MAVTPFGSWCYTRLCFLNYVTLYEYPSVVEVGTYLAQQVMRLHDSKEEAFYLISQLANNLEEIIVRQHLVYVNAIYSIDAASAEEIVVNKINLVTLDN